MRFGTKILFLFIFLFWGISAHAYSPAVKDLQDLPSAKTVVIDSSTSFDESHWVYKSLKNISQNHGMLIDLTDKTFDGSKPLTRNEAALLLVNLVGKIDQDNVKLSQEEKIKLDILKEELKKDTQQLVGRVSVLETDVKSLKGSVSKLEQNDKRNVKINIGDSMQLNGGFIGSYTGVLAKGSSSTLSNFNIGLLHFGLAGK